MAAGLEEGNGVVDVVLEQLDVAALQVHPALLMQAGAVEGFVVRRDEALAHALQRAALGLERGEAAATGDFLQQRLAVRIEEAHPSIGQRDFGGDVGRDHAHRIGTLADLELRRALQRCPHQAAATLEIAVTVGTDPHDAVADHLQSHVGGLAVGRAHDHAIGPPFDRLCRSRLRGGQRQQCRHQDRQLRRLRLYPHRVSPLRRPVGTLFSINRSPASPAAAAGHWKS